MTRFTPDQIAEYKECFDMFVQDDEDAIDEVGLAKVMETLGTPMSEEEIKEFILEVRKGRRRWKKELNQY